MRVFVLYLFVICLFVPAYCLSSFEEKLLKDYRHFFVTKEEYLRIKEVIDERSASRKTNPPSRCLKSCSINTDPWRRKRNGFNAAYHCCCSSSVTYIVVLSALDFMYNQVQLVTSNGVVQAFYLDDCVQYPACTTCSCGLDYGYHKAVYWDGPVMVVGDVMIPTSCKCFNT